MLRDYKRSVEVRRVVHRYSFGTHAAARRREVDEYLFIGH
jgi:DNA adenine methylase/adenine-specific DNA-methyltransferase